MANKKKKASSSPPPSSSAASASATKKTDNDAAESSLTDWVAALAQKTTESQPSLPTKAERVAKRQAKKQRKEQQQQQRLELQNKKRKHQSDPSALTHSAPASKQRRLLHQERILQQWREAWQHLVEQYITNRTRYSKRVETSDCKPRFYPHTVQHKKAKLSTIMEPRKSDYGGLGLARPTLYLAFTDPSWQPRLEEAFAEHVPGWSGKPPMMQAMKKQRDANLLWKRLQREKKNTKANRHMTPDERVEALLKSGSLV